MHRATLAALASRGNGDGDLARLAHHAEAAGDAEAVLRFAPAAAARAASLGAHREAAAQYARALRFGEQLGGNERAELLELCSRSCYLTDQYDEGIAALERAVELRRAAGDRLRAGDDLRSLAEFLWCPGRVDEAERRAQEAVAVLEELPPGRELAAAYTKRAFLAALGSRREEGIAWARRAIAAAEGADDPEITLEAQHRLAEFQGIDALEDVQARAIDAGVEVIAANLFLPLAYIAVEARNHAAAKRYLADGIAYCSERGFELFRLYLLAARARLELDEGRWSDAADSTAEVLRVPRTSISPRINSLVVLGLVRARRGDPGASEALEEAWALAEPTGELLRLGPVAAARAEEAWLRGDSAEVNRLTAAPFALAVERGSPWLSGELALWRRRAGLDVTVPEGAAEPYALELAGASARAAELWRELGCPYEAALACAAGDDVEAVHEALAELHALGAARPAALVARRLRELGERGVVRGPRPSTRANPGGLTARELDVLALLAQGLRNAQIADRLVVSPRTVDHHVSTILRKLSVETRAQAVAEAARLGVAGQDP